MTKKTAKKLRSRRASQGVKSGISERWNPTELISNVGTTIVPTRMSTVLRFQTVNNSLSFATTQSAYVTISVNGAYDPLYTLGGGSCTGFAELAALYNRYIVTKAHIRMDILNSSTNSVGNNLVAFIAEIPASQVGMVGTTVSEDILESRRCTTNLVSRSDAVEFRRIERDIDVLTLEGLPSLMADYENLSGSKTANPDRTCVALCGATRPTGPQASNTAEVLVVVDYYMTFYQPTVFTVA